MGTDHAEDEGKKAIIVRDLYCLKSSGADFRAHLCESMASLGYKPCLADPDLWLKAQNQNGIDYYSYILCYVDDIMVIHHDARPILDRIDKFMKQQDFSWRSGYLLGCQSEESKYGYRCLVLVYHPL